MRENCACRFNSAPCPDCKLQPPLPVSNESVKGAVSFVSGIPAPSGVPCVPPSWEVRWMVFYPSWVRGWFPGRFDL